ncbi:MAG: DUF4097 family beta strand repeat-containing protein [Gemmatimonadaceae bacterium]
MRTRLTLALLALAVLAAGAPRMGAQSTTTWQWNGTLGAGRTVFVRNLNGTIRVTPGTGRTVEVVATKKVRRGDPDAVRIEARMAGTGNGDVLVCALWGPDARCDETSYRGGSNRRGTDIAVELVVKVPADAKVTASTVNGSVALTEIGGDVEAATVNGSITARSLKGRVNASTVNGSITAQGAMVGDGVGYKSVNGSITVTVPEGTGAELDLSTVNGRITTEHPVTLDGTISRRRVKATMGKGGPTLKASTVNGSVTVKKG